MSADFDWYGWVVIPLFIFLARVSDVTLSTIRLMFVMSGRRKLAPLLGAVEVTIWLTAIGQIMQNLNNVVCFIAYAAGFATGTYIGMFIEERIAFGTYIVRVITNNTGPLAENLRANNFGVTEIEGEGNEGTVKVLFVVIKRSSLNQVISLIREFNPDAFYTVGSIKYVSKTAYLGAPLSSRDSFLTRLKKSK